MKTVIGSIVGTIAMLLLGAMPVAAGDHSGPYIGLMAGYGIDKLAPKDSATTFDWAQAGAIGGVFAGYGAVVNGVYVGIEGDMALKDLKATMSDGTIIATSTADWQGTIRGRAGIPMGPALIYGTLGLAMEKSKLSVAGAGSDSNMVYGLVVGGGIEANLTKVMFVRVEGRYTKFQEEKFGDGVGAVKMTHDGEAAVVGGLGFRF